MMTDTNLKIKQYFDEFYKSAAENAKKQALIFVESHNLNNLSADQQVLKLHDELRNLNQRIDDFERKEYINFATFEVVLYKIFSSRLLFFKNNEREQIQEGLLLANLRNNLVQLYLSAKAQLPPLSFSDFLNNEKLVVFYELHQRPVGISEEEYHKMRNWQIQRKIECVNLESKIFRERFRENVGDQILVADKIKCEMQQLEYLFKNANQFSLEQFSIELAKLNALSKILLPENLTELHNSFCRFIEGDFQHGILTPKFFDIEFSNIQSGILSQPPICCWSFIQYDKWLNDLLENKIKIDDLNDPNYNQLFELSFNKGIELSEKNINDFKKQFPSDLIPVDQYQSVLFEELNKLRIEFNQFAHPNYYHFLLETETVKSYFLDSCFLGINAEIHQEELKQAIVLNEMIVFFLEEMERIHRSPIDKTFDDLLLDLQITDLITSMIPEPDLMDQLITAFSQTTTHLKKGRKPVLFIIDDLKDAFNEIYNQAANNLQQLFESHPAEVRGHFASCQVRDMQHKELTAKRNGRPLHEYFDDLKQLFNIELDFVQTLQNNNPVNIDHLLQEPDVLSRKKLSFGFKKTPELLAPIIQALNVHIDFLDNRTTQADFIKIVTSDDLESISDKIYIGCQTNEFRYTLKHFKYYFKTFNPAKIGRSDIFRSCNDNPFTADNLYNAKTDFLLTKDKIDKIFNQKQ